MRAVKWLRRCWPREEHCQFRSLTSSSLCRGGSLTGAGRKFAAPLTVLRVFCPEPAPLTVETHERAVHIAERYGYSIFDSLIIAAALQAGARTLYSEDMQDGQAIDGLIIRNPFSR